MPDPLSVASIEQVSNDANGQQPLLITDSQFAGIIEQRISALLQVANYLYHHRGNGARLTRPLLSTTISESSQLEELLDAYGARSNTRWFALRELVATARIFASVGYILLHISHAAPRYFLLPVKGDFVNATRDTLDYMHCVLTSVMTRLLEQTSGLGLSAENPQELDERSYQETLPAGALPRNRRRHQVSEAKQTVVHLATQYLELAAESSFLHVPDGNGQQSTASYSPDVISEELLRHIEHRFHNLQSLYDTYLADTDTEEQDETLPILRGHITVVFHLLEAATLLCHYQERHLSMCGKDFDGAANNAVNSKELIRVLLNYFVLYSSRYVHAAASLCHDILRRYAEIGRIKLPVPQYRGFHVRPSMLIAKIVKHYGSDVSMYLEKQRYDAGSPLDFFRANEEINAMKRRRLAGLIADLPMPPVSTDADGTGYSQAVRHVILTLAERNELIIYKHPLPIETLQTLPEQTVADVVLDAVKHLLSRGTIDVESHTFVVFEGDTRVLEDIRRLAEAGYGEDRFGNNIPLPAELSYLQADSTGSRASEPALATRV